MCISYDGSEGEFRSFGDSTEDEQIQQGTCCSRRVTVLVVSFPQKVENRSRGDLDCSRKKIRQSMQYTQMQSLHMEGSLPALPRTQNLIISTKMFLLVFLSHHCCHITMLGANPKNPSTERVAPNTYRESPFPFQAS